MSPPVQYSEFKGVYWTGSFYQEVIIAGAKAAEEALAKRKKNLEPQ